MQENVILWVTHLFCGVLMGAFAFLLILCEDLITEYRCEYVQTLIDRHNDDLTASYFWYALSGVMLVLLAVLLTLYV
jgi:hypothetical protein